MPISFYGYGYGLGFVDGQGLTTQGRRPQLSALGRHQILVRLNSASDSRANAVCKAVPIGSASSSAMNFG
jgi:hypothetical protein